MLAEQSIVAFVATAQPDRAREFYEQILGLRLIADEPPALVFDAHGVTLRIAKVQQLTPQPFTVLGWHVPDIAATVDDLRAKGVTFERYPGMEQDDRGIWPSPGGAQIAWFKDPDGNVLSLAQG